MFKKALILMIAVEVLSFVSFKFPVLVLPTLVLVAVGVFALSYRNIEWGVYILFAELFFGSRGRLLEYDLVSLRMVIFGVVLLAWLIKGIMNQELGVRKQISIILNSKFMTLYALLLLVIFSGAIWGFFQGNGSLNVLNDVNGYLYLLILPVVFSLIKSKDQIQKIIQILGAAIVVVALKSLMLFVWFAGDFVGVSNLYHWVIQQDIGEITGVVGSASRIFMQSQFYSLIGIFLFGALYFADFSETFSRKQYWLIYSSALLGVMMSLSRSFWFGAMVAGVFALSLSLGKLKISLFRLVKLGAVVLLIVIIELGGLYLISESLGDGVSGSVSSRIENPVNEAAGNARLLLLPELLDGIEKAPIFGSGFGTEASYKSFLPDRITPTNPHGDVSTFSFEWGYLDLLLKLGIIGFAVYLFFIANIFKQGWNKFQNLNSKFQTFGLLSGLVALVTLNVTTPYLNHPLGIGYLVLIGTIFYIEDF